MKKEGFGEMEEKLPEGWDRLSRIFSGQPAPDHAEFFVERVMGELRRPEPAPSPLWPARWWVPALAPALALFLLMIAGQHPVVSTQMLLDTGSSGWVANTRASAGGLLELMEEGS